MKIFNAKNQQQSIDIPVVLQPSVYQLRFVRQPIVIDLIEDKWMTDRFDELKAIDKYTLEITAPTQMCR